MGGWGTDTHLGVTSLMTGLKSTHGGKSSGEERVETEQKWLRTFGQLEREGAGDRRSPRRLEKQGCGTGSRAWKGILRSE